MKFLIALIALSMHFSMLYGNASYMLVSGKRPKTKLDTAVKRFQIADNTQIPQKLSYYAKQAKPMKRSLQERYDKAFNQAYFSPWSQTKLTIDPGNFQWEVRFIRKKPIFHANGKIIPPAVYEKWIANARYDATDSRRYRAITVRHTDLKSLPVSTPFYRDPKKVGEGFPFDYNQNSALYPNTPLYLSHFSEDRRWAFVQAPFAFGWVKLSDIALVNQSFIDRFQTGVYGVAIRDNSKIIDPKGEVYTRVKLGTLFPYTKEKKHLLLAQRNRKGQAFVTKVAFKDPQLVAQKPLAFTPQNLARIAVEFYDEPYGWGGGYYCRDCSALTRDFFTPFGIFLRRNSSQQAKDGKAIPIPKGDKAFKKAFILKHAKPFRSLLYVPGHVVLYLGEHKGEPVIFHNYWGVRKKDGTKLITARTMITTTEPGKERSDIKEKSKLIHTLRSIVNF